MTDAPPVLDSNGFNALAYGVFDGAPDTDSGRAALLQAYNSHTWDDPKKALDTLEYYGQAIKYKNKDQSSFGENIQDIAPVKLEDIPISKDDGDKQLYEKWKSANLDYLKSTTEPQYVVARKQLSDDVSAHADAQIRQANEEQTKARFGERGAAAADATVREIKGITSPISPLINAVSGFDLNSHLTSFTDPDRDQLLISKFAQGIGSTVPFIIAPTTAAQTAVFAGSAVPSVYNKYEDTKAKTGDTTAATEAAGAEAVSQGIQYAGERLVFGAGGEHGSIPAQIGKQAAAQGAAQVPANLATNIENQKPSTFQNLTEGVPEAAAIGGAIAGVVGSASSFSKPSKANTTDRSTEINQDGFPTTPTRNQVVGTMSEKADFVQAQSKDDIIDPINQDLTAPSPVEQNSTPAFATEDGAVWNQLDSGHFNEENSLPHDRTLFLDHEAATKVTDAIVNTGEHAFLQNGEPVIERVKEDGTKQLEPVPYTAEPTEGSYALPISEEKKVSGQEVQRPVALPRKVTTVNTDRSIGAAGTAQIEVKESLYGKKLQESLLPNEMRAVGEKGIQYPVIHQAEVDAETNSFVSRAGIEGAVKALDDTNIQPALKSGIGTYLHNYFNDQLTQAYANNDPVRAENIAKDFEQIAPKIAYESVGKSAQALALSRGKTGIDGLKVRKAYTDTYETSLANKAKELGVSPVDIAESSKSIDRINSQLDNLNKNIENKQTTVTPETQALDTLLKDIEDRTQSKVDAEHASLDSKKQELKKTVDELSKNKNNTEAQIARLEKVTQKLQELETTKSQATVENRMGARDKAAYEKYTKQKAESIKTDSPEVKAAKEKLQELNKEKARVEKLLSKKKEAEQEALAEAQQQTKNQQEISKLKELLKDPTVTGTAERKIRSQITARESIGTPPGVRDQLFGLWVADQVGGGFSGVVALKFGAMVVPANLVASGVHDVIDAGVNIAKGRLPNKSLAVEYAKNVFNKDAFVRGIELAKIAFKTGERLGNILPREDVTVYGKRDSNIDYQNTVQNFAEYTKSLEFGKNPTESLKALVFKSAYYLTQPFMRSLAAAEALEYAVHDNLFDRTAAAYYYDKAKNAGVTDKELFQYQYNPKENWQKAQAQAAFEAQSLRDAGVEFTKEDQYFRSVEKYQEMRPSEIQISAYKQAGQITTTAPAGGLPGLVSDLLHSFQEYTGGAKSPFKFLVPFANSIANRLNVSLAYTPYGLLDTTSWAKRTSFEKSMIRAQAITGTVAGVGVISYLKTLRDQDPTKPLPIDFVADYSTDAAKRDAFTNNGGLLKSMKVGGTYIDMGDSPFGLWAYGIGAAMDNIRDGKDPDPELTTVAMHSSVTMVASMLGGAGGMSMLQGITNITDAIKGVQKGDPKAEAKLTRALVSPVKGFIPGASLLRTAARFFNSPVDSRHDIASALVEGLPVIQAKEGRPALNIFGEPMHAGKDDPNLGLHRIFSNAGGDTDISWLVQNGYNVPNIDNMAFSKKIQEFVTEENKDRGTDAIELNYDLKYKVMSAASADLRTLVGKYREKYGTSASNPAIGKALKKDFSKILTDYKVRVVKGE